jgi:putative oxidoreductase
MTQLPWLPALGDAALLFMRLLVAAVFLSSGWSHVRHPVERGNSIGMSPAFTRFLGTAELAGALGVAFGVLIELAAIGLILIMLGAIQKKIFAWHTGFWGKHGTDGWHYDLLFVAMNLVIATTGGGRFVLMS